MIFHVSNRSGVPLYLQIVQQAKEDIRLGFLKEGDKLPAVREVVTMTAINPNTVVKAYRELENQGLIEKRSGIGTFIARQPARLPVDIQTALSEKLDGWIDDAESAGLDEEASEALFNRALRKRRGE
jgi:DNA-binding transcriptional regulator YhcF (GntR family)